MCNAFLFDVMINAHSFFLFFRLFLIVKPASDEGLSAYLVCWVSDYDKMRSECECCQLRPRLRCEVYTASSNPVLIIKREYWPTLYTRAAIRQNHAAEFNILSSCEMLLMMYPLASDSWKPEYFPPTEAGGCVHLERVRGERWYTGITRGKHIPLQIGQRCEALSITQKLHQEVKYIH